MSDAWYRPLRSWIARPRDERPCLECSHRRDQHLAWVRYDEEGNPDEAGPCHVCSRCFGKLPRFEPKEDK